MLKSKYMQLNFHTVKRKLKIKRQAMEAGKTMNQYILDLLEDPLLEKKPVSDKENPFRKTKDFDPEKAAKKIRGLIEEESTKCTKCKKYAKLPGKDVCMKCEK